MRSIFSRRPALPSWLTSQPIAHRGLHDALAPENTRAAFAAAIGAGYPIELDVHVLADGEVIVFHDADLHRATGLARALDRETSTSIYSYRIFGSAETIPSLRDVLALVQGRVPLLIEVKAHGRAVEKVVRAILHELHGYAGPYAVQSFNPWVLAALARRAPHVLRGQLGGPLRDDAVAWFERIASRRLFTCAISRAHFVNYDLHALPDAWVSRVAQRLHLPLLAWTVRSEPDRQRAEGLGVNYVFDHIRPGPVT